MFDMVIEELFRFFVCNEGRHSLHERHITVDCRYESLSCPCPLKIHSVTAGPFPCVVDIKDRLHVPFCHFSKEIVQSTEDSIIVDTRFLLKSRHHPGRDTIRSVTSDKNAQIGHSQCLESIKLSFEAGPVSSCALASKNGSVPEIGSHEMGWIIVTYKQTVFNFDKLRS